MRNSLASTWREESSSVEAEAFELTRHFGNYNEFVPHVATSLGRRGGRTVTFAVALNRTVARGSEINHAQNPVLSRPNPIPDRKTTFDAEEAGFWFGTAAVEGLMAAPDVVGTMAVLLEDPRAMFRQ